MEALGKVAPEHNPPEESLPAEMLQLVSYCVSLSAGCRYCQAHTGHGAEQHAALPEVQTEKRARVLEYETAECFSDSERTVVGLALAAGQTPNGAETAHFDSLRIHFNGRQITQVVAVIALFGFLNRWNDTIATALEDTPKGFAETNLAPSGMQTGKHS